jgi:hypothetical protein
MSGIDWDHCEHGTGSLDYQQKVADIYRAYAEREQELQLKLIAEYETKMQRVVELTNGLESVVGYAMHARPRLAAKLLIEAIRELEELNHE